MSNKLGNVKLVSALLETTESAVDDANGATTNCNQVREVHRLEGAVVADGDAVASSRDVGEIGRSGTAVTPCCCSARIPTPVPY